MALIYSILYLYVCIYLKRIYWRRLHHLSVTCGFRLFCESLNGKRTHRFKEICYDTQTRTIFQERCFILYVLSLSHTNSTGHLTPQTAATARQTQREEKTSPTPKHPVMDSFFTCNHCRSLYNGLISLSDPAERRIVPFGSSTWRQSAPQSPASVIVLTEEVGS